MKSFPWVNVSIGLAGLAVGYFSAKKLVFVFDEAISFRSDRQDERTVAAYPPVAKMESASMGARPITSGSAQIGPSQPAAGLAQNLHPREEFKRILTLPPGERGGRWDALFADWIKNDFGSFELWIRTNPPEIKGNRRALDAIGEGLVHVDADTAFRLTSPLGAGSQSAILSSFLRSVTTSEAMAASARNIAQLDGDWAKWNLYQSLGASWSELDSTAALEWFSQADIPVSIKKQAAQGMAAGLASNNPATAIAWIQQQPVELRANALDAVLNKWAALEGAKKPVDWLKSSTLADKDGFAQSLFRTVLTQDIEQAMHLTTLVRSDASATALREKALVEWRNLDPAAAAEWVAQSQAAAAGRPPAGN